MKRPEEFSEVYGNKSTLDILQNLVTTEQLDHFIIICGPVGVGKTTTAKLLAKLIRKNYEDITETVIRQNGNTAEVLTYKMAVDGDKDAAKDVLSHIKSKFKTNGPKVLILEELQDMDKKAQKAFLSDFEYIPDNIYVIGLTTDWDNLIEAFQSRAVKYELRPLPPGEMVKLLKKELKERRLTLEGGDTVLEFIAQYADYKPRTALKVLASFGTDTVVSLDKLNNFLNFIDINDLMVIVETFSGNMLKGINFIMSLTPNKNTFKSLVRMLIEVVSIMDTGKSKLLTRGDNNIIKMKLSGIKIETVILFLKEVSGVKDYTCDNLLHAYLKVHPYVNRLTSDMSNTIQDEYREVAKSTTPVPQRTKRNVPDINTLLNNSEDWGNV